MIHFYVGKPRNGKSLRVMMKIIDVLVKTQQHIVTNMVIRCDVLQEYLDSKGHNIHVCERITIIDDEETKNFWLYRAHCIVLPTPDGYGDKTIKDPDNISYLPLFEDPSLRIGGKLFKEDGSPSDFKGTCYVIDEVQNIWPARGWQGTGHHIAFYLSQHGKLGDTVFFITQNVKNVDRLLYSLAQDFTYCRNHRLEKHGKFRGEDKFSAKTYPGPIQNGDEVTLNTEEFQLDKAIAACYDTSAGVGMPGGGTADAGFRAKGLPLKLVWVGLAAVLLVCFLFFQFVIPKITGKYLAPAMDANIGKHMAQKVGLTSSTDQPNSVTSENQRPQDKKNSSPRRLLADDLPLPPEPILTGIVTTNTPTGLLIVAYFSDGTAIPPQAIQAYNFRSGENWILWQNKRYYLNRALTNTQQTEIDKTATNDLSTTKPAANGVSSQRGPSNVAAHQGRLANITARIADDAGTKVKSDPVRP